MTDHRRSLLTMSALLLRQLEDLTDELVQRARPLDEIHAEACEIQRRWIQVMDELSASHAQSPLEASRS